MMWIVLVCASFCELGFTVCMKLSDGFKNKKFTVLTVLITALGIFLLSTATKTLPLGIAYAVWTGLGTVFTVLFGIFVFKESRDRKKIFFMCLVVAGVIGLRLCTCDRSFWGIGKIMNTCHSKTEWGKNHRFHCKTRRQRI